MQPNIIYRLLAFASCILVAAMAAIGAIADLNERLDSSHAQLADANDALMKSAESFADVEKRNVAMMEKLETVISDSVIKSIALQRELIRQNTQRYRYLTSQVTKPVVNAALDSLGGRLLLTVTNESRETLSDIVIFIETAVDSTRYRVSDLTPVSTALVIRVGDLRPDQKWTDIMLVTMQELREDNAVSVVWRKGNYITRVVTAASDQRIVKTNHRHL